MTRQDWTPLRPLTGLARGATWVIGAGALIVVIANLSAMGWLPGTGTSPVCVERVCTTDPTTAQSIAGLGHQVPQALFGLGALALLVRFLRTAWQEGPYADTVPGRLSTLGWFVLAGAPAAELLHAVSRTALRDSLLHGTPAGWFTEWRAGFPWWSLAAGITALTFAHILTIGVRMREDLEGTV
ncbi:hypothetical protein BLA60_05220 [Actinophytocola xinjiangensis]|uniref:DUF2975 family protein n=1 Tax=Actinophytocola xinjiangensis TaxID=485602 RepID=A0A7Z0WPS0_9PSEU|nr:hypothetical protein [Actinophytocola xinjiangensis]OLF12688.1 hypothetical protein BLA60_05220 [Actinophytocola xinjiangensis]